MDKTYFPNNIVEFSGPLPYTLLNFGWGQFPIKFLIEFVDQNNKPIELFYVLKVIFNSAVYFTVVVALNKLDYSQSGHQVLGDEKWFDIEIYRHDFKKISKDFNSIGKKIPNHSSSILDH